VAGLDFWSCHGQTGSNPPRTKAGFTALPTLDGDNWRNQGSAASNFVGEVAKSSWLRIQSVNRVFGLTLTEEHLNKARRTTTEVAAERGKSNARVFVNPTNPAHSLGREGHKSSTFRSRSALRGRRSQSLASFLRIARIFFSAAVGLLSRTLMSVCFGVFVPQASLLCVAGLGFLLFRARACLNFAFQFVDALSFFLVFSTFRWRETSKDFIPPSLILLIAEACQFGLGIFLSHENTFSRPRFGWFAQGPAPEKGAAAERCVSSLGYYSRPGASHGDRRAPQNT
jgi:hypothetical protein